MVSPLWMFQAAAKRRDDGLCSCWGQTLAQDFVSLFSLHCSAQPTCRLCLPSPPPHLLDMLIGVWPGCLAAELEARWSVPSQRLFRNEITRGQPCTRAAVTEAGRFGSGVITGPCPSFRQHQVLRPFPVYSNLARLVVK